MLYPRRLDEAVPYSADVLAEQGVAELSADFVSLLFERRRHFAISVDREVADEAIDEYIRTSRELTRRLMGEVA